MTSGHLVFAFGTLKRGFPLHVQGLGRARNLGAARTVLAYPMLIAGPWFAPMMFDEPGTGHRVLGELYEVDETTLAELDRMESVGQPGNFRVVVAVEGLPGLTRHDAFVFVKSRSLAILTHSEYLEDYQDRRFIPSAQRTGNPST